MKTLTLSNTLTQVETTRFGTIEVEEDLIINFPQGMIGFENCHRFVVLHHDEKSPFRWFQCLDHGAVAFPILDPWVFKKDYSLTLPEADALRLQLKEETPKLVFVVLTVPKHNPMGMTANLLGPLVVNAETRIGMQVVLSDDRYTTKHRVLEEMNEAK